jgi:hypothetical protein
VGGHSKLDAQRGLIIYDRCAMRLLAMLCLLWVPGAAMAQVVIDDSVDHVGFDEPEAWAMSYVVSSTLLTGFGETPTLAVGEWAVSAELGHIPKLDRDQQQVGLGGSKNEDLNKSPVFGRGRVWVGLPWGVVGELAYTPPLQIDGVRPSDLFAFGVGKRWIDREVWSLSTRAHGQIGSAHGDITCPADIAGESDPVVNPFGCVEASDDRIKLRYYALEATGGFGAAGSRWRGHMSVGLSRYEPHVQVNARTRSILNRPQVLASGTAPYFALGATRHGEGPWDLAGEVLYVPLDVRRDPTGDRENDPFWSLRAMLRYRFGSTP